MAQSAQNTAIPTLTEKLESDTSNSNDSKCLEPLDTTSVVVGQQKIIIPNEQGEKLVGILHETGSLEIVILCHGSGCTKDYQIMVNLAASLENERISAFRFDFSGNGESEGSYRFGSLWRETDDIHAVIQHFLKQNRVICAILGHSKGGVDVLLYGSKYGNVPAIINVSGRYDLMRDLDEEFIERVKKDGFIDVFSESGSFKYRVTWEDVKDYLDTDLHEACRRISKKCRVLTVHGSADVANPVQDAFEFDKIIPNHKLHIVEGADHFFNGHQAELDSVVVSFVKEVINKDDDQPGMSCICC